jgi:hypothetical protein
LILAHRVCGFLNMQPPIKVKLKLIYWGVNMKPLGKPTKYMLMGSTGAVDPILPLSVVASLRHQSIINMNEKGSALTWQDPTTLWNLNFSRLFMKLMG